MPWLGLALERATMSGRTNYLLALHLARRGALDQALIELRLAADYAPGLADQVGAFAVKLKQDPEWLSRVAPDGKNGAPVLFSLATHLPSAHARAQDAFLEEATVRDPAYVEARTLLVKRLLAALEAPVSPPEGRRPQTTPVSPPAGRRPQTTPESGRCAGADAERCARVVVAQCAALERLLPDSPDAVTWRARALMLTGRPAVAAQALSTECARLSDRQGCLRTWLEAAASARKADMVARAAKEIELSGCAGPDGCASAYEAIADALDRAGDKTGGLDYYEKAARQRPTAKRWQRAADAAAAIGDQLLAKGDVAGAITYSERAARADPTVARWRRVAELKEPPESVTSMPSGTQPGSSP